MANSLLTFIIIILFLISCKKEKSNLVFGNNQIENIKSNEYWITKNIKLIYSPNQQDSIIIQNQKDSFKDSILIIDSLISEINFYENKNIESIYFKSKKLIENQHNFVNQISFDNTKALIRLEFEPAVNHLFEIEFYNDYKIKRKSIVKDSIIRNHFETDSLKCTLLEKEFYENGNLKSIGCGTNYKNLMIGRTPVGVKKVFDSIHSKIIQTDEFYINDDVQKSFIVETKYDANGKTNSKIKTNNYYLSEVGIDTIEILNK